MSDNLKQRITQGLQCDFVDGSICPAAAVLRDVLAETAKGECYNPEYVDESDYSNTRILCGTCIVCIAKEIITEPH